MEKRKFNDLAELGNHMYELANEELKVVTAVLLCENAIKLIKWLMSYDDITVGSINIENEDYHGYNKEFYITLDTDLILDVTPAYQLQTDKTTKGYLTPESDIIFYDEDASLELTLQNTYENKYELIIGNYDDEDECGNCCRDCSNCSRREASEAIAGKLGLINYIFNHLGDN